MILSVVSDSGGDAGNHLIAIHEGETKVILIIQWCPKNQPSVGQLGHLCRRVWPSLPDAAFTSRVNVQITSLHFIHPLTLPHSLTQVLTSQSSKPDRHHSVSRGREWTAQHMQEGSPLFQEYSLYCQLCLIIVHDRKTRIFRHLTHSPIHHI